MQYLNQNLNVLALIATLFFCISCDSDKDENEDPKPSVEQCGVSSVFTDPRDGKTYDIIQIGTQCWFAQNLDYESDGSWCYNDNVNNCNTYGRFYTWDDALSSIPAGWHLPTNAEWMQLAEFLGGVDTCGAKMKQVGNSHWNEQNSDATNESGFTGLPGGARGNGGNYDGLGDNGYFWTNTLTEINENYAFYRGLSYLNATLGEYSSPRNFGISVRCVKD